MTPKNVGFLCQLTPQTLKKSLQDWLHKLAMLMICSHTMLYLTVDVTCLTDRIKVWSWSHRCPSCRGPKLVKKHWRKKKDHVLHVCFQERFLYVFCFFFFFLGLMLSHPETMAYLFFLQQSSWHDHVGSTDTQAGPMVFNAGWATTQRGQLSLIVQQTLENLTTRGTTVELVTKRWCRNHLLNTLSPFAEH